MASNITIPTQRGNLMPVSKVFADAPIEDLGEGIRSALGQLSILGNVFSIRYRGVSEELPPAQARQVEVVILKSAKTQSKAFWPGGYGGDNKPPTCWSSNSLTPDAQVPADQVQAKACGTCPNDAFVTASNGMKQKPCGDHKRLAIVPVEDLTNEAYGGAMIFRVPAGSLGALDKYGNELTKFGIPYYAYTTFITLTLQNKVTKLTFDAGRPLNDDEALIIKELRADEKSGRIINEMDLEYETGEQAEPTEPPKTAAPIVARPATTQQAAPQQARPVVHQRPAGQTVSEQKATRAEPAVSRAVGNTISGAVSKPAAPPVSQRQVETEVVGDEEVAEENGETPSEMEALFQDLMKR